VDARLARYGIYNASVKGRIKLIYGDRDTFGFECEIMHPKSQAGRTVYVLLQGEDIADLLKELRAAAVRQRSKPMDS
jgi:hypothetical protein